MQELIPFIPEALSLLLAVGCLYTLYKLEVLYLQELRKRPRMKKTDVLVDTGLWRILLRDRLAQTVVALIAIPDIPVLVKLFSGGE